MYVSLWLAWCKTLQRRDGNAALQLLVLWCCCTMRNELGSPQRFGCVGPMRVMPLKRGSQLALLTWFPRYRHFWGRGLYLVHLAHTSSSLQRPFCSLLDFPPPSAPPLGRTTHSREKNDASPKRLSAERNPVRSSHMTWRSARTQNTRARRWEASSCLALLLCRSLRPHVMYTLPPLERA